MQEDRGYGGATEGAGDAWNERDTPAGGDGSSASATAAEGQQDLEQLRERADEALGTAADALERAARKVDAMAELLPGQGISGRAGDLGHGAADTLESVARFLRDNDVDTLQKDVGRIVAARPLTVLLLAVGAGFVVGKALR